MTGWLVDTSAISAFAPGRSPIPPSTAEWFEARTADLYFSTVTFAEIEQGVSKLLRKGAHVRASQMRRWFETILVTYGDHVLPFDLTVALAAGAMSDAAMGIGRHPGFPDVAIAATASTHGFNVLTCNLRHFEPLGVPAFDPFDPQFLLTAR